MCATSRVVLCGVTLVFFLDMGTLKSLSVLLPDLQEQFTTYTWVIGLAIALAPGIGSLVCLLVLPGIRSGGGIDPTTVLIICGILCGLSLIIGSLTTRVVGLVLALTMEGSFAVAKVVSLGVLATYFRENNIELATAICVSGQSVGTMLMPPMTQLLKETYGWRGAMLLLGALGCHIICIGVLIRYAEKRERHLKGYTTHLQTITEDEEPMLKACFNYLSSILNLTLLSNVSFINALVLGAASGWTFSSWIIYLIPHAQEKGIAPSVAVFLATVGGISNLIGKLCCPVLRQFISNRKTLYLACILCSTSLAIDPLLKSMAGISASSTIFALSVGLEHIANLALIHEVVDEDQVMDGFAWCNLTFGMSSLAGGFLSGLLFDVTGSYDVSFMVMAAVFLVPVITLASEDIWRRRPWVH